MESIVSALPENSDSWEQLMTFLPAHWESKCSELGALRRFRNFSGAPALLRTLMIHLVDGCSLRETKTRAKLGGIADVSDVALLKRLNRSGEWFRWMTTELLKKWSNKYPLEKLHGEWSLELVDATHVSEPGNTGTDWRIHYAFNIQRMECTTLKVTDYKVGESFKNFDPGPKTVYVADRGYYHHDGIEHVVAKGGNVLVRMNLSQAKLFSKTGKEFNVLRNLRSLKKNQIGEWNVCINRGSGEIHGRVCAIRKGKLAAQKSKEKVRQTYARKQKKLTEQVLIAAEYVFVFTTLPEDVISASRALELYRGRWQIELVFKRLKSIIGLGHLPKQDPEGAKAWIHGKIFCAFLIETLIEAGERFFPWGFLLEPQTT